MLMPFKKKFIPNSYPNQNPKPIMSSGYEIFTSNVYKFLEENDEFSQSRAEEKLAQFEKLYNKVKTNPSLCLDPSICKLELDIPGCSGIFAEKIIDLIKKFLEQTEKWPENKYRCFKVEKSTVNGYVIITKLFVEKPKAN